ncbi:FecR family protein [Bacteroides sp.]|uniref:FecR family protein n=1 Tax=Bacteroides sp. TaxID=29523 RepID=UPI0025C50A7E|nr:FecR domain-containing protein [Bacteroides sp.]
MKTDIYKIKTDKAWNRLYDRLDNDHLLAKVDEGHRTRKLSPWMRYGAVAAVLIGIVCGAVYWVSGFKEPMSNLLTQENQSAFTLATTLEDGSVVLLAGETSLLYPEHFIADKREVSLEGNAFFDIAKKQGQPFWINTEQAKIEVLGTAFSVQSGENTPFRLSVQRGTVRVSLKKGNQECYVKAGETVTVQSQKLIVQRTDKEAEDWSRFFKHIRFKDEPLTNILKVMNLSTDSLQIQVDSPALAERRLTVEFSDESPEVVANLIASALNLKCIRQGNVYNLSE